MDMADTVIDCLIRNAQSFPHRPAFTFVDFSADPAGRSETVTWRELECRVHAVADLLSKRDAAGRTIAVVAPQGIDYVTAFFGVLRAGGIAVPLFVPHAPGLGERLASALADSEPLCVLTTGDARSEVAGIRGRNDSFGRDGIVTVDSLRSKQSADAPVRTLASTTNPVPQPADCAYLQYTSGSTREPAGVEITHANLLANVRQAVKAFDVHHDRSTIVSWLPLFHDMGLVLGAAIPAVTAVHSVLFDPLAFVQRPSRWLSLLADHKGAVTAAPNFAYDYCVRRIPASAASGLVLRDVAVMINGSEPIRSSTLTRFQGAFGPHGLDPAAVRPSYGLAEATVLVSTSRSGEPPRITSFDRSLLRQGRLRPATAATSRPTTELVACGAPVEQTVAIVDGQSGRRLRDGEVGEIWLRGPNVGRGYWRNPMRTTETFGAVLADEPQESEAAGPWLRTGDLGALLDGHLYVTGRMKDLIIIDGTNHYPQDIEATAQESYWLIRDDHVAAFSLDGEDGERLVIVAEHSRRIVDPRPLRESAARSVRAAVQGEHGVAVHDFVLVPPGSVPRTTSGKVARDACRRRYVSGAWARQERQEPAREGGAE